MSKKNNSHKRKKPTSTTNTNQANLWTKNVQDLLSLATAIVYLIIELIKLFN